MSIERERVANDDANDTDDGKSQARQGKRGHAEAARKEGWAGSNGPLGEGSHATINLSFPHLFSPTSRPPWLSILTSLSFSRRNI